MGFVLRKYEIDNQACTFSIETRRSGLLALLLTYLKLSPVTSLEMKNSVLEFRTTNWLGYKAVRVPAQKVTGVICGLRRNWIWLLIPVIGIWPFLKLKEFFIGFENGGDGAWIIAFDTKNILQNREISQESLEEISEMIKKEMLKD